MKTTGPSLSPEASGSLADVLTYSRSGKATYAKKHAAPNNPKTGAQTSVRAMISFLSKNWHLITPADQATWEPAALQLHTAPYHAYLAENMKRWTQTFRYPSTAYPATELPGTCSIYQDAFDGIASCRVRLISGGGTKPWGWVTFRSQISGFTPAWDQAVNVIYRQLTGYTWWTDTPLAPGTYYYRTYSFTHKGTLRKAGFEDSATAS